MLQFIFITQDFESSLKVALPMAIQTIAMRAVTKDETDKDGMVKHGHQNFGLE